MIISECRLLFRTVFAVLFLKAEVRIGMVQEATKKETLRIAAGTGIGVCLMAAAFGILHMAMPDRVPFDYRVFTGGIAGGAVAVLNFFLMGLTVQQVAGETDDKRAYQRMKVSYSQRMLLQIVWIILALTVPVFNGVAGVLPLLFPSLTVKLYYIFLRRQPQRTKASSGSAAANAADTAEEERGDSE